MAERRHRCIRHPPRFGRVAMFRFLARQHHVHGRNRRRHATVSGVMKTIRRHPRALLIVTWLAATLVIGACTGPGGSGGPLYGAPAASDAAPSLAPSAVPDSKGSDY